MPDDFDPLDDQDFSLGENLMETLGAAPNALESQEHSFPDELFIFPLLRRPFFPGMAAPVVVEPGPYYEVLKRIAKSPHKCVGLLLAKSEEADIYDLSFKDLYRYGVVARVLRIIPSEQGGAQVILNMEQRMKVTRALSNKKFLRGKVSYFPETNLPSSDELKAYSISIISTIKELLKLNPLFKEELQIFLGHSDFTEPGKLADFAVALTTATRDEQQDVLETFDTRKRIDKALKLLKKELDISQLQSRINHQIDESIAKNQREFFLREQLRSIRRELGIEKDDKSCDQEKFEARLEKRTVPAEVREVINDEMDKLQSLDTQSAEYSVCRGYLDWLTVLPWGMYSEDRYDLKEGRSILENDHYGLDDIKDRIIEFISVGKLSGGLKGNIICLVGPPGVGKTSVGRSIARALNREFYRFSVGGMRDEAEIKGHRRTYVGAMPGKLIQALKKTGTMNPVIMLDEVDKLGASYQGDPASALLEVLDPEQNKEFLDHYMDVRCDLSSVLFIVTANVLDSIPEPLLDRMEVMRLSGYVMHEKIKIAQKYLIPRHRKSMGLLAKQVSFTKESLRGIIHDYAREAGVRSLENNIKKILRKVATEIVSSEQNAKTKATKLKAHNKRHAISVKNLSRYLGKPTYNTDLFYKRTPAGVSVGLAWTAMGGATLYIESVRVEGERVDMKLTGQAGDVMKESSQIAWSYLQSSAHKYAPKRGFFRKSLVHIHIPEGATPKDGPSAGVTMLSSLISLLTNTPVLDGLAMTGELTLTGRILPVGGIKEKVVAARRADMKVLVMPAENKRDFHELPEFMREGLEVHFVQHYDDLFKVAFPTLVKK